MLIYIFLAYIFLQGDGISQNEDFVSGTLYQRSVERALLGLL